MAHMGHRPSGRLFEAAACGTSSSATSGKVLADFYEPGAEIVIAWSADDVSAALNLAPAERRRMAERARARTLAEHPRRIGRASSSGCSEHAGHHPGCRQWHAHSAARLLEGAAARRQSR